MKRLLAVGALVTAWACSSSTGPTPADWVGTWRLQTIPDSGWSVYLSQTDVALRDSADAIWATVPALTVNDDGNTDPVSFSTAPAVKNAVSRADSLSLTFLGSGTISGLQYQLRIAGTRSGTGASGSFILDLAGGGGSPAVVGSWTASKQ